MYTSTSPKFLPQRLEPIEQDQPLLVLDDLYRNQTEFPVWRRYLYAWYKGIFSSEAVWSGKSPAEMLNDLEQMERLIEASWMLLLQRPHPEPEDEVSEKNVFPPNGRTNLTMLYWSWDFYPRWLNKEELRQPYLVLNAFFDFLSLPQWREQLNIWLKQSLSVHADDEFYNADEVVAGFELLNKLLEATHLIYIRELIKNPDEANSTHNQNYK